MIGQMKNMLIGLFVILAMVLIVGFIFFIRPTSGDGGQTLHIRFVNINGISQGTPVMMAGKNIGQVKDIKQIRNARKLEMNKNGTVYFYLVSLQIDSHFSLYTTDEVSVQTQGLLGEKVIQITPHAIVAGSSHLVTDELIINGDSKDPIDSALEILTKLSDKFDTALDQINHWFIQYGDKLGTTVQNIGDLSVSLHKTVKTFNEYNILEDIKASSQYFAATTCQVYHILDNMQNRGTFEEFSKTINHIQIITKSISEGKGFIGKLVQDDGLYLDTQAIMSKVNTLLNDINRYGLLFNYNKTWQRTHLKNLKIGSAIKDPAAFSTQMNHDLDSMKRTLDQMQQITSGLHKKCNSLDSKPFRKQFAQFMHEIDALQKRVELYNEQLKDYMEVPDVPKHRPCPRKRRSTNLKPRQCR
jgi:phospholipid/cholesterol/gamma-HCH transport system substrate-binding protein